MDTAQQKILSDIGAMQTLIDNFPHNLGKLFKNKVYNTPMDFVIDCLQAIGITTDDLISYVLSEIFNEKFTVKKRGEDKKIYNINLNNSAFLNKIEKVIKSSISFIMARLASCEVHPKIPNYAFTSGIKIPLTILDPNSMLSICPVSDEGALWYDDIEYIDGADKGKRRKTGDLSASTDLNTFIWYCIYKGTGDNNVWNNKDGNALCKIENYNYDSIILKIDSSYSGKTLYQFNMDFLDSIEMFSPRILINSFYNYLYGGILKSASNASNLFIETLIQDIIKQSLEDDTTVSRSVNSLYSSNDCYYTFSNESWPNALQSYELKKYSAVKNGENTVLIDKTSLTNELNSIKLENNLFDTSSNITTLTQRVELVNSTNGNVLNFDEGWNGWLKDIMYIIEAPFINSIFSPKVLSLMLMNFQISGMIDMRKMKNEREIIIEFFYNTIIGLIKDLSKIIYDAVLRKIVSIFLNNMSKIIVNFKLKQVTEAMEYYLFILLEALEKIRKYGSLLFIPKFKGENASNSIDDVNYADILNNNEITPKTNC